MTPALLVSNSEHVIPENYDGHIWYKNFTNAIYNEYPALKDENETKSIAQNKGKKRAMSPRIPIAKRRKIEDSQTINSRAILQHTYTLIPPLAISRKDEDMQPLFINDQKDEGEFMALLDKWFSSTSDEGLRLTSLNLKLCGSSGFAASFFSEEGLPTFVLKLPDIPTTLALEDLDLNPRYKSLIESCLFLKEIGKVSVNCDLRIEPIVSKSGEDPVPPFKFVADILIGLNFPQITDPINYAHTSSTYSLAEAQRRLLLHVIPPAGKPEVIDVPFFYNSLHQAPPLPTQRVERLTQPSTLLPNLLPFQRRSTHRLLSFEGKGFDTGGRLVEVVGEESGLENRFLQKIHVPPGPGNKETSTEEVWYFNRLTGSLSTSKPETVNVGGLLAEEMGLGMLLYTFSRKILRTSRQNIGVSIFDIAQPSFNT